ncbi:MAG: UDP-glucose/GDP-mannose dehydrogenase family protein [Deltaproteobacteria bacterium]|nr:UDP-glucose/GDP-mannose dehydrogenase family protein [Deltaproteobacteria bacterium]
MKNIVIFGGGYVGLVTACGLADVGNRVTLIEKDGSKLQKFQQGQLPFFEPGLNDLFQRHLRTGHLTFKSFPDNDDCDLVFICVGTPSLEDGSSDLSAVFDVGNSIANSQIKAEALIVLKSTCPPGTTMKLQQFFHEKGKHYEVAYNPEFLRQGSALEDTLRPDRIVLGVQTERAKEILEELYKPFVRNGNPIIVTTTVTAELVKYVANCYLATRISFINEVAHLCELFGADIQALRAAVGLDPRIGIKYFYPGCGYGGSCFPKDVASLINFSSRAGYDFKIARACRDVNNAQRVVLAEKVLKHFGSSVKGKILAAWGLAFKNSTDDVRESPAYYTICELKKHGVSFRAFDPEATKRFQESYPDVSDCITYFSNQYETLESADGLIIFTDWNVFKNPDYGLMASLLREKVIFDGRNLCNIAQIKKFGFTYFGIGVTGA